MGSSRRRSQYLEFSLYLSGPPYQMVSALHLLFATQFLHGANGHAYMSWPASRNFDDCQNFEPQSVNQHCDNCNTEICGMYNNINYGSVAHAPTGSFVAGGMLDVETI